MRGVIETAVNDCVLDRQRRDALRLDGAVEIETDPLQLAFKRSTGPGFRFPRVLASWLAHDLAQQLAEHPPRGGLRAICSDVLPHATDKTMTRGESVALSYGYIRTDQTKI